MVQSKVRSNDPTDKQWTVQCSFLRLLMHFSMEHNLKLSAPCFVVVVALPCFGASKRCRMVELEDQDWAPLV